MSTAGPTGADPGQAGPSGGRWARRLSLSTPPAEWSVRRRAILGLAGLLVTASAATSALHGPHARGPWFAALAAVVFGGIYASLVLAPRRGPDVFRRHPRLDEACGMVVMGLLVFLGLALATSLPLSWCGPVAAVTGVVVVLVGHRRRASARRHSGGPQRE